MQVERDGQVRGLWEPPRSAFVTQALLGVMLLVMAVTALLLGEPGAWDRVIGLGAALMAGMSFGVVLGLFGMRRMVRRHMAADHPGVPVPQKPRP